MAMVAVGGWSWPGGMGIAQLVGLPEVIRAKKEAMETHCLFLYLKL
jgi:hypothetical protein